MVKKSKTQKAKASAARVAKKEAKLEEESRIDNGEEKAAPVKAAEKTSTKNEEKPKPKSPKKKRFKFFREVKAELKKVTWSTPKDVIRWSGVVLAAILFFGILIYVLDNVIWGPLVLFISGFGG